MNKGLIVGLLTLLLIGNVSHAEDSAALRQLEAESNRQARDQANKASPPPTPSKQATETSPTQTQLPPAGGACFNLQAVVLQGEQVGLPKPSFIQRLVGQCADTHAIASLIDDLNRFYQEQGFITTRVSVPKQNLKSGTLKLTVTAGKVGSLAYADGKPADSRLFAAFPTETGDLLELRKLEQGLDNFNRAPPNPPSSNCYPVNKRVILTSALMLPKTNAGG